MPRHTKSQSDLHKQLFTPYDRSLTVTAAILVLCWLPASAVKEPQWLHLPNADKWMHFSMFAVWAFCLQLDVRHQLFSLPKLMVAVLLSGAALAALTELLQPVVSNRLCEWQDGLCDMAGTGLGILLFYLVYKKKRW